MNNFKQYLLVFFAVVFLGLFSISIYIFNRMYFSEYRVSAYIHEIESFSIYHEINTEYLKKADVIILGDSRPELAFLKDSTNYFFKKMNLSFYLMAMGQSGDINFVKIIFDKLKLHPKYIIIGNSDRFFESEDRTRIKPFEASSYLSVIKKIFDNSINYYLLKSSLFSIRPPSSKFPAQLKSKIDGTAILDSKFYNLEKSKIQTDLDLECKTPLKNILIDQNIILNARKFISMLNNNTQVILTIVPPVINDPCKFRWVKKLSDELNVPFIYSRVENIYTYDGFHMTPKSADIYANSFYIHLKKWLELNINKHSSLK